MGKALAKTFPVAKAVFDEVDDALGQKLSAHHVGRPQGDCLTLTENAQPALDFFFDGCHARSRTERRAWTSPG